ncbi:MAG: threonine synthase [Gemmatimonadales bacterium]
MSGRTLGCRACGAAQEGTSLRSRCECGGLLELRGSIGTERPGAEWKKLFAERRLSSTGPNASGVWRYRELVYPEAAPSAIVTFPEGNTPLLHREALNRFAGLGELLFKHEGQNPTGSFKDRGMTVGATHAARLGVGAVACASTGNTAASMAAYAAQAGLTAVVLVPEGRIALGKLAQTVAYGAKILAVRGDFDACLRLVDEGGQALGLYLLNSINPFRLEGQKAIVLELLDQLGWNPPDWIVLPAGNLGNLSAFGRALSEARALGLIDRLPRLAAIQAAGAAPFAKSFADGFATRHRVDAETVATAIRIGDPASYERAVESIRLTNGVVTTATDAEILEAKAAIDRAGVGCEPASAASLAGVRRLVREGTIAPTERAVAVLTGHLLKDPEILLKDRSALPITEVDATLSAVAAALE